MDDIVELEKFRGVFAKKRRNEKLMGTIALLASLKPRAHDRDADKPYTPVYDARFDQMKSGEEALRFFAAHDRDFLTQLYTSMDDICHHKNYFPFNPHSGIGDKINQEDICHTARANYLGLINIAFKYGLRTLNEDAVRMLAEKIAPAVQRSAA